MKSSTNKRLWFAVRVIWYQFLLCLVWVFLFMWLVGVNGGSGDPLPPTIIDRTLGIIGFFLFAPIALTFQFAPNFLPSNQAPEIATVLLLNFFLTAVFAYIASPFYDKFKKARSKPDR